MNTMLRLSEVKKHILLTEFSVGSWLIREAWEADFSVSFRTFCGFPESGAKYDRYRNIYLKEKSK